MNRAIYNLIITILYIPYICLILFRKILNKEHKLKFKENTWENLYNPRSFNQKKFTLKRKVNSKELINLLSKFTN